LEAGRQGSKLAYERRLDLQTIVVLINSEETAQTFRIDVDEQNWENLLTGDTVRTERGKLIMKMPAYGFTILKAIV
jgi:hypothetical protein